MNNSLKKVLALVSVGILALGLAGCGGSQSGDKKAAKDSGDKKAIVVATRGTAKPFSFTDDKGNLTGYDVEILKEIEKRDPSLHFEFKPMSPDAAFVAMKSKQVDMIANQMRRNPTREKKYIYTKESNNYTARKLVVKEGRTDIHSFDDLGGKKVAITSNSEFNDMVKEFNKNHQPGIEPIYSDKGAAENLNLVATGRADAAGEYEYVVNVARKEQGLPVQAVGSVMQSVPTFFLLRKDPKMQEVADRIDQILKQMKEDGTLKKLSIQYLGKDYTVQPQ